MHLLGLRFVFPSFDSELQVLYDNAKYMTINNLPKNDLFSRSQNLYGNHYAMTNPEEYFAEGVQSFFDANIVQGNAPTNK